MKANRLIPVLFNTFALGASAALLCFVVWYRARADQVTMSRLGARILVHKEASLVALRRPARSGLVVAEFGDYACPFCRKFQPWLDAFLQKHRDVQFQFHDCPLVAIHAVAFDLARMARMQNITRSLPASGFCETGLSESVMLGRTKPPMVVEALSKQVASKSTSSSGELINAYGSVSADLCLSRALGIHGTPTFIVVLTDGTAYKLNGEQLERFLGWKYGT